MLKKTYVFLLKLKRKLHWFVQSNTVVTKLDKAKSIQEDMLLGRDDKIIIVVPHPDDELIGCFGIMKSFSHNTTVLYSGLTGDDKSEETKTIRSNEITELCEKMKVNYKKVENDFQTEIENVLKDDCVKYVFVPSYVDWHTEHRMVFKAVMEIKKNFNLSWKIFCYNISVPIAESYITHFYIMDKKLQREKWNLFKKIYISQNFMPVNRYCAEERAYKLFGKRVAADVYMRLSKDAKEYEQVENIRNRINDLRYMKEAAEHLYNKIFG